MNEEKIISEAAKELGLKDLAPEIYKDLLQPAAREIGEGLVKVAQAVCIATAPFELTVWGYERIREYLAISLTKKLSQIPPEKIIPPAINIAGPILINFPFVSGEKELRDLYANLLASAMHEDKKDSVHPSFAFLIQQLSSEEAVLIKHISSIKIKGWLCEEISDAHFGDLKTERLRDQFEKLCLDAGLKKRTMFSSYMENLIRLRILYHELQTEANYVPEGTRDYREPPSVEQFNKEVIQVSEFGWAFIEACI